MKKYSGEELIRAIGELDEELLSVPTRKARASHIFSRVTVAASFVLCFAVAATFFIGTLGNLKDEAPNDMNGEAMPPTSDNDIMHGGDSPDNENNAPIPGEPDGDYGESGGVDIGDGSSGEGGAEGEGGGMGEGSANDEFTYLTDIRIGYNGHTLNIEPNKPITVKATRGHLYLYVELMPGADYSVCDEGGNELEYEVTTGGAYRLYKLSGAGKVTLSSTAFESGAVREISYVYYDGIFEIEIIYN